MTHEICGDRHNQLNRYQWNLNSQRIKYIEQFFLVFLSARLIISNNNTINNIKSSKCCHKGSDFGEQE